MHTHSSREKYGFRWWLYFGRLRSRAISVECYWWSARVLLNVKRDDEGLLLACGIPPVCAFVRLPVWRAYPATQFRLAVHDWKFWIQGWGPSDEWARRDPWWRRGIAVDPVRVLLGKESCVVTKGDPLPVTVPMPEGNYAATATTEVFKWQRPRWFSRTRQSVWLDIPKGIPHAGKGENSWDCGDDGLFGIGGNTLEDAIGRAVASVLKSRRDYGHASPQAVHKAVEVEAQ